MSGGPHVSINAETLLNFGGVNITNSLLTSSIVSGLLILFAVLVRLKLKQTDKPQGLQNFAEWLTESLYNLTYSVAGNVKRSRFFFPFIATFFLFIVLNNWVGLIPGVSTIGFHRTVETESTHPIESTENKVEVQPKTEEGKIGVAESETQAHHETTVAEVGEKAEVEVVASDTHATPETTAPEAETQHQTEFVPFFRAGTADLNTTFALALISVFMVQLVGIKFAGLGYFSKFFNFSSPLMFFVGLLEIISEFAKILSFAFRLFGNIFAGEVLLAVITFLVPILLPAPFYGMEIFVGFIQALVFAMLTLVFFNMAASHHKH